MDINNLDKVNRLREELAENHYIGSGILECGVDVSVGGKTLDIPEALSLAIEDLVTAHFVREGQGLVSELSELGVDATEFEAESDNTKCDCPACAAGGENRRPMDDILSAVFGGLAGAPIAGGKSNVRVAALSGADLAKIFGADLASMLANKRPL